MSGIDKDVILNLSTENYQTEIEKELINNGKTLDEISIYKSQFQTVKLKEIDKDQSSQDIEKTTTVGLISCEDCNHQISSRASSCPNCGYDIQRIRKDREDREQQADQEYLEERAHKLGGMTAGILFGIVILLGWFGIPLFKSDEPSGLSEREIEISTMKTFLSSNSTITDFKKTKFSKKTDLQVENWEKKNKDKIFILRENVYDVVRTRERLTDTGGYNKYTITFQDTVESAIRNLANDPLGYEKNAFKCTIYAYTKSVARKLDNLSYKTSITFAAKGVNLGSFYHSADICVLR